MGGTLTLKFNNKATCDKMFTFVNDHFLTFELCDEAKFDEYSTLDRVYIEKEKGNKISFDYPIWYSGPNRLWLETFAKWAALTAGIKKSKVDGKVFEPPVPVIYSDSVGWYNIKLKKNGQPDYYLYIENYIFPFYFASYNKAGDNYIKELTNMNDPYDYKKRYKIYIKHFGEEVKPILSKIDKKIKEMTRLWNAK